MTTATTAFGDTRETTTHLLSRGWAALPASLSHARASRRRSRKRAPGASGWPNRTTKISTSPRGFCPRRCARTFTPSTPTAASPTISAMKSATRAQSLCLARFLGPRTRRLLRRPRAPSRLCRAGRDHSRLLHSQRAVCRSARPPSARIRPSPATQPWTTCFGYCRYSANPVGRLVLYACGDADEERFRLSDATCSALQLANFWQDVRVDFAKDRVYHPAGRHAALRRHRRDHRRRESRRPSFAPCSSTKSTFARSLFEKGFRSSAWSAAISPSISISSAAAASKFCAPSSSETTMCSARAPPSQNAPSSRSRCAPSAARCCRSCASARARRESGLTQCTRHCDEAYAVCRAIAKREAKNFYYAFVALPPARRNAICAIYAFMRKADDLADDESHRAPERRTHLDAWLASWHRGSAEARYSRSRLSRRARRNRALYHSAQPARRARRRHHDGSDRLSPAAPDTYATFADLYRYCYLVASVVGLVCIRIFGYNDPRAEKLAEETGIAFQLTNILRDVAEDAERNRVYLPLEDLAAHNVTLDALLHRTPATPPSDSERALLAEIAAPRRSLLSICGSTAAAHRSRKPPRAVGAGLHLSRACSNALSAPTTMSSPIAPACPRQKNWRFLQQAWRASPQRVSSVDRARMSMPIRKLDKIRHRRSAAASPA